VHQVRDGESRIDDVLDDEDVLARDRAREVLRDLHDAARLRPLAVRAHAEEVDAERRGDGAGEIGAEDEAALEDAYEHERAVLVLARDRRAELPHALGDLRLGDHRHDALGHGEGGCYSAERALVTSSERPSLSTTTAPSRSVRHTVAPA